MTYVLVLVFATVDRFGYLHTWRAHDPALFASLRECVEEKRRILRTTGPVFDAYCHSRSSMR